MGYVIVIANAKGGVGKTLYTVNIAGELALRGYTVGIIDTDSQGNVTLYLGMEEENGLYKALIGVKRPGTKEDEEIYDPVPLETLVRQVPLDSYLAPGPNGEALEEVGPVYVLPGSKLTFEIPLRLEDTEDFTDLVNDFIELYQLDFLLIDTSPTLSVWDGIIYDAVDGALFIAECDPGSLAGIQECYDRIQRKNARRKKRGRRAPIDLLGVIPNKFVGGREQSLSMNALGDSFGEKVFNVVPSYKTISRSVNYGQTVRANVSYNTVASKIMNETIDRVEHELAQVIYARTT